jgi:hypothetical protein
MFDILTANIMQLGRIDYLVLMLFGFGGYGYSIWFFREPDPTAQYLSLDAFLSCVLGLATSIVTFLLLIIFERVGYVVSIVISPFLLLKVIKKIQGE